MNTFLKWLEWVEVSGQINNRTVLIFSLLHDKMINMALWNMALFNRWMDYMNEY